MLFRSIKLFSLFPSHDRRGIRKAEDKDFVQIWDLTSSCKFAKRHLTQRKKFYTEANYPYAFERVEWK